MWVFLLDICFRRDHNVATICRTVCVGFGFYIDAQSGVQTCLIICLLAFLSYHWTHDFVKLNLTSRLIIIGRALWKKVNSSWCQRCAILGRGVFLRGSFRNPGNNILSPSSCIVLFDLNQNGLIYRSGMVNSNTVNSKFHLIRSYCENISRFLSFHV